MVNCIIVDDEPLAQQILESHVLRTEGLRLVKKCSNALTAFDALNHEKTDLLFLDIKMPSISGIDFIRSLKNPPAVIFTTAFSEYAAASYDLNAVDYLLKPITYERFCKSIEKYLKIQPAAEPISAHTYFKVNGKLVKLDHTDIICAQSIKDYIIITTTSGNYITHMTMKYLAELLPRDLFRRVHRSYLIGIKYIAAIGRNEIELQGVTVPVGESYKMEVDGLRVAMMGKI